MKVTLKYDQGVKANEVIGLEVPAQEFETMIEFDYQERLANAKEDEVIERRTPQEIFNELNRAERNSWQTHNRRSTSYQNETGEAHDMDTMDMLPDYSQLEEIQKNEDYEEQYQRIRNEFKLKPDQADMMIAICLDGMLVKEYAEEIGDDSNLVSKRFVYTKKVLKEILSKN